MSYNMKDPDAFIEGVQEALISKGYSGGDATGTALNRANFGYPESVTLVAMTKNGSANDVVSIDIQESSDDGSSDSYADISNDKDVPALNGAADQQYHPINLSDVEQYVRCDLASADQTVNSTIDLFAMWVVSGTFESQ